jgi:hypothetical protein
MEEVRGRACPLMELFASKDCSQLGEGLLAADLGCMQWPRARLVRDTVRSTTRTCVTTTLPAVEAAMRDRLAGCSTRCTHSWWMAVGSMPNMRLCVRVRCDESENPASCAASVHDAPAIAASMATLMRSHSM